MRTDRIVEIVLQTLMAPIVIPIVLVYKGLDNLMERVWTS